MNKDYLKNKINEIKNKPKLRDYGSFKNVDLPDNLTGQMVQEKLNEINSKSIINFDNRFDICSSNLSNMDFKGLSADVISFDDKTLFPSKDNLPKDFNPEKIMEDCKNPGLGIKSLHEQGITGKSINIAIIDQPLSDHIEYSGKIKHYEEIFSSEKERNGSMHGAFVTSLAIGENCGAAPGAKCYYFATTFVDKEGKEELTYRTKALNRILEINEKLSAKDRIQAVSISGCFEPEHEGYKEWQEALAKAKEKGLVVITANLARDYGITFSGMQRDVDTDLNDISSYSSIDKKIDKRVQESWISKDKSKNLLFPCDHRTGASHQSNDQYMHASRGGISWIMPHVTGMFAMARQVNPECTFEHFCETAFKSGIKDDRLNGVAVNPVSLIKSLELENSIKNTKLNSLQSDR